MFMRYAYLSGFTLCMLLLYWGCRSIENRMPATVDFNYHIRPILVQKCYLCHGPDASSRQANLRLDTYEGATVLLKSGNRAIDLKHTEKSMVLFRINHTDPDMIMPTPDSKLVLTEKEKELLEKWIQQGAAWKPHWAFISPEKQNTPDKNKNPIDYFIDREIKNQGLTPVEEASKNSLIRRVSFLLTGLPPSPSEVQSFLNDSSSDAYPKMVDKYLNSPHFGERWARHWMDLVRFAETKGHEFDYAIPGAWRYRDYLIRAFNGDIPYNQLVKEHLAGDLLPQPRINKVEKINESQLGPLFFAFPEGTHSPVDIRKDEADRIDNLIDVTGKTFLGLTVSCAKCHDHKFDPISTKDYYALYGVMEGTRFSPASPHIYETKKRFETLKGVQDSIKDLVLLNWMDQFSKNKVMSNTDSVLGNFTGSDLNHWKSDGLAFTNETTLGDPIFNKKANLVGFEAGKASSKRLAKGVFGALRSPDFIIDKNNIGVYASGSKGTIRIIIDNFQLISYPIYGGLTKHVDNEKMDKYLFDVSQWKGHKAYVEILPGIYDNHLFKMPKDAFVEVKYVISFNDKWFEPPLISAKWNPQKSLDSKKIKVYLEKKERYQSNFPDSTEFISSITDGFGKNSPVFIRGNHNELSKEKVPRSFLSALSTGKFNLNVSGSGRLALAEAITNKDNPLTYRVFVNRVWHHLFGKGIVETVDNFGLQGKLPTHPELLDYLALSFVKEGYSMKKLIRQIVLSETFKRTTKGMESSVKKDPLNHYLSFYPLRRLEAESLRDAILSVSGNLDSTLFGKSVPVHITSFMNGRGKPGRSGPMDGEGRRSIYVEMRRNFLDPFMSAFDRPIPFTTFGKRTVTNVPAQALILMNDPFIHNLAAVMVKKMNESGISGFTARIQWIYQRAFSRNPSEEEIISARSFYESLKKKHQGKDKKLLDEMIWKDFIHTHFNLKEFIYLI
ncbi:MAG: PSD1 and planctomycete cytochrome C domain-containing protein [Saprospiraceae bacterium]|nr:PSD1 and planctomycete cytochrome C domain-containing protein [Saprospiraceae bacterium]